LPCLFCPPTLPSGLASSSIRSSRYRPATPVLDQIDQVPPGPTSSSFRSTGTPARPRLVLDQIDRPRLDLDPIAQVPPVLVNPAGLGTAPPASISWPRYCPAGLDQLQGIDLAPAADRPCPVGRRLFSRYLLFVP
jgi:hypothetical protein